MTSGAILPSVGPSPPEFRRSFVPEHLRPQVGAGTQDAAATNLELLPSPQRTVEQAENKQESFSRGGSQSTVTAFGRSAAVAVQVQEGNLEQQPEAGSAKRPGPEGQLTEEELAEVKRLKERDREVRAHEAAHAAVGRGFTGTPSYEYATGPDGIRYAVGGHVDIDVSEVPGDPAATIAKMEVVRAAALAPAQPSGQDRAVAAAAAAKAREAQGELAEQKREELEELQSSEDTDSNNRLDSVAQDTENQPTNPSVSLIDTKQDGTTDEPQREPVGINLIV